jgi:ABC-type uncharacterized transport system auxiliary subunit
MTYGGKPTASGQTLVWDGSKFIATAPVAGDLSITSQAQGSILYYNGSNWVQLSPSTSGFFLKTQGAGANPVWAAQSTIATDLSITSQAQGSIVYYNGSNWVQLSPGTDGYFLKTQGSNANPVWAEVASSEASDLNISGETRGDILFFNGTNWTRLPAGNSGEYLKTQGSGSDPVWSTATASNLSITSQSQGDILYYNGSSWVRLAAGTSGHFLKTQGTGANPTWSAQSTTATDLSLTSQAQGSIAYYNGSNWVQLAPGTSGYMLRTNGAGANPTWDVATAGDLTVSGQVQGSILYFNGSNWVQLSPGTDGYVLRSNGSGANPSWMGITRTNVFDLFNAVTSTQTASVAAKTCAIKRYNPSWLFSINASSTFVWHVVLETTSASNAAYAELNQITGSGSPRTVATTAACTTTSATDVTVTVSTFFANGSVTDGLYSVSIYLATDDGTNYATCSGSWIEITP